MGGITNILTDVGEGLGLKLESKEFLRAGFFTFEGLFIGVGLNEICNNFNIFWPKETLIFNGHDTGIHKDFLAQIGIAVSMFVIGKLFNIKHADHLALGTILGAKWADSSERRRTLSVIGLT